MMGSFASYLKAFFLIAGWLKSLFGMDNQQNYPNFEQISTTIFHCLLTESYKCDQIFLVPDDGLLFFKNKIFT